MKKKLTKYILSQAVSKFMSFITGMWASGLVSAFFDRKNSENLWGLQGDKKVLNSESYQMVENILAILIGFMVLLLVDYIIETKKHVLVWEKAQKRFPVFVDETKRYISLSNEHVRSLYLKYINKKR